MSFKLLNYKFNPNKLYYATVLKSNCIIGVIGSNDQPLTVNELETIYFRNILRLRINCSNTYPLYCNFNPKRLMPSMYSPDVKPSQFPMYCEAPILQSGYVADYDIIYPPWTIPESETVQVAIGFTIMEYAFNIFVRIGNNPPIVNWCSKYEHFACFLVVDTSKTDITFTTRENVQTLENLAAYNVTKYKLTENCSNFIPKHLKSFLSDNYFDFVKYDNLVFPKMI